MGSSSSVTLAQPYTMYLQTAHGKREEVRWDSIVFRPVQNEIADKIIEIAEDDEI